MRPLLGILMVLLMVGCESRGDATSGEKAMQPFQPGQIWTYKTRPGEENSRIVICRVEEEPKLGQIVHIHVNGIRMKNRHAPGGISDQTGHMPYSADALRKSLTNLESAGASLPSFEHGYQLWRTAFDSGEAGVWTAPVAEAISGIESAMSE